MKKWLKASLSILVLTIVTSCSKDDDKVAEPSIVGKWEFSKEVTYDELNQEVLEDYTHRCESKKDFMQFDANGTMNDSYSSSNCQAETGMYTYVIENDMVKFYNGNTLAPYSLKILSLTNSQAKVQWVRNATARAGTDTYILIRK